MWKILKDGPELPKQKQDKEREKLSIFNCTLACEFKRVEVKFWAIKHSMFLFRISTDAVF